jgi:hypothetical protein
MSVAAQTSQPTSSAKLTSLVNLKGSFLGDQSVIASVGDAPNVPKDTINDAVAAAPDPNSQQDQQPTESQNLTSVAQALPIAIDEMTDTLNPAGPISGGTVKEVREPGITLERPAMDQVPGVQYVEEEKTPERPEIPPEVESYLQEVGNNKDQIPQEVVIGDQQTIHPTTKYLAQPVIVLPITPEVEKQGATKSAQFSVRWLVEWSRKMMKVFSGRVVYKKSPA